MKKYEFTGETKVIDDYRGKVTLHSFLGKIDKFLEKVTRTHVSNKHALVYRAAVELAKAQIDLGEENEK